MYDYIFWIEYRRNLDGKKGAWLSRHSASGVVFMALFLHFGLCLEVFHAWLGVKINLLFVSNHKVLGFLGALICIWLVYVYYNKGRIQRIDRRRSKDGHPRKWESAIVWMLVIVPLILIMVLGWNKSLQQ